MLVMFLPMCTTLKQSLPDSCLTQDFLREVVVDRLGSPTPKLNGTMTVNNMLAELVLLVYFELVQICLNGASSAAQQEVFFFYHDLHSIFSPSKTNNIRI